MSEQGVRARAKYGSGLLKRLSHDPKLRHGKACSGSGIIRIRQFYLADPKGETPSHLLNWPHFVELLKIDDFLKRCFYEQQTIQERCTVRELIRQTSETDLETLLGDHLQPCSFGGV